MTYDATKTMKANRSTDTGPEVRLRRALRRAGLNNYRKNYKAAPGSPDVAFPKSKVAVMVHGCFWHDCPSCHPRLPKTNSQFWADKRRRNRERDARDQAGLDREGWATLVVWEHSLKSDEAADRVARFVKMVV